MTQSPNPFSREGSSGEGLGSSAGSSGESPAGLPTPAPSRSPFSSDPPHSGSPPPEPSANTWPSYPAHFERPPTTQPPANPYGYSAGDIGSYGSSRTGSPNAADAGFVNPTPQPVQAYPSYGTQPSGASPYGPNPYGGYGYAMPPPIHPQAIVAFVVSLVSLLMCQPVGIIGFVLGARARRQINANPAAYSGRGLATAGWVLGIVCIVTTALGVLGLLLVVASS